MTFYTATKRQAHKPHTCGICLRTIDPGEVYERGFGAETGGEVWNWVECAHCCAFRVLADVATETEYGQGDFECYEPDTFTEWRWFVQWNRQWRRRDGGLYPVPTAPAEMAK